MTALEAALRVLAISEGGYSDDPDDRGGRTNLGVTWETLANARHKLPSLDLPIDIAEITRDQAEAIYREVYWRPIQGDDLPPAVAICLLDHAVNVGPHRAVTVLQRALGVGVDGIVGPVTIAAAGKAGTEGLLRFCAEREAHYAGIVATRPSQRKYIRGWRIRTFRALLAAAPFLEAA